MNACRSNPARNSICLTSNTKAVSSATKLPVCLSSRSCVSIWGVPQVANLPENIVHGATPLPMRKAALCLDGRFYSGMRAFQ